MRRARSLSPIEGLSENAFKTVVDIDLVRLSSRIARYFGSELMFDS